MRVQATEADVRRFLSKVEVLPCGCWFYSGGRSHGTGNCKDYGSFWVGGRTIRAHRFACDVLAGLECPPGHHRDHTCEFSLCVCPDHFEIVTHEENQRRKVERRRSREDTRASALADWRARHATAGENETAAGGERSRVDDHERRKTLASAHRGPPRPRPHKRKPRSRRTAQSQR